MKRITYTLIIFCIAAFKFTSFSSEKDVRILQSDASGILLEFNPVYLQTEIIKSKDESFVNYSFEGEVPEYRSPVGSPMVKYRSLLLRFPGLSNHTIEIISADYEIISGVNLPPFPDMEKDDEGNPKLIYATDSESYSKSGYFPEDVAAIANVGIARHAVLGNINIYPLQYNAASAILKRYTRIVFRVNFGNFEVTDNYRPEDELLKDVGINYEIAKNWFIVPSTFKKTTQTNSLLATGTWYRFNVTEDGIYKIDGSRLLAAGIPASTNPNTIKIYNNGGFELSFDPYSPYADDLMENAVFVQDAGTANRIDADDFILFYGKGTTGWKFNAETKTFSHYINRFADANVYWLTYDGATAKRMVSVQSLDNPAPFQPAVVTGKVFREDEKVNVIKSGTEWLGQQFSINDAITYVVQLPGLDTQQPIRYNFRLAGRSHLYPSSFNIAERQQSLGDIYINGTYIGNYNSPQAIFQTFTTSRIPNFSEPRSELKFKFTSSASSSTGYIDWFELFYSRLLNAQNDLFSFHTHDTTGIAKYSINGFSSNDIRIFDVSDFNNTKIITSPAIITGSATFQINLTANSPRELFVVGPGGYKTPPTFVKASNQNLHGAVTGGDSIQFIIITHADFKSAANRLKTHRENQGADRLRTLVVDVNEIYNEFGGGLSSPMAIRNFLKYAYQSLPFNSLKYVLLFGDGDYDYKRITTTGTNWIPPWQTVESYSEINSFASEDPFTIFDGFKKSSLATGRLAVRSLSEANTAVDKIIEYENNPVRDPWKMRVTFVADDGPAAPGENDRDMHTTHAEDVAFVTPNYFEKRKIYIVEYPSVITSTGIRKPTANQSIVKQINDGTLIINFSGHGNPRLWTHEQVFVRETDFQLLQNKGKYFYLIAATCNYSQFDVVGDQSGGEILVNKSNSGAIGVFAATRAVYAWPNRQINIELIKETFKLNSSGRIIPTRIGNGIYAIKQLYIDDNTRKFFLLGDPSVKLAIPKMYGSIDTINNFATSQAVTLKALEKINLTGAIKEEGTNNLSNMSGKAQIVVYDANKTNTVPEWGAFSYKVPGGVIFRGESSVSSGKFKSEFIIPKDISYDTLNGRITLYFWNNEIDGLGYTENFKIRGTDTTASNDNSGPDINIYFNSTAFRPGDIVNENPILLVDLFDESGINSSGSGIGHRIEAWLDDNTESVDLTPYYKSKLDTYKAGTVEYKLENLKPGSHTLKMRAWDVFNNASNKETIFDVLTGQGLTISNVFNYPNPFSDNTTFTFNHNQIIHVDAEIKIYSVAGRLLNLLSSRSISEKFVHIEWDGRDRDGNQLSNGIYLYKIILKTQDGRFTSESFGKLSVLR